MCSFIAKNKTKTLHFPFPLKSKRPVKWSHGDAISSPVRNLIMANNLPSLPSLLKFKKNISILHSTSNSHHDQDKT